VTYMYVDLSFKFGNHHEDRAAQRKDTPGRIHLDVF
jgi:hypothetical protein